MYEARLLIIYVYWFDCNFMYVELATSAHLFYNEH